MRIIYFSPHPTHDIVSDVGYSTHQREMINALRQLGHEVFPVIIGGATKEELPSITKNQRPSRIVSLLKQLLPGFLWRTLKDVRLMNHDKSIAGPRLRSAIAKYRPDLVYERSEYFLGQGSAIASEFGVKHIYEVNAPCVVEWLEFEGGSFLTKKAESVERMKSIQSSGFCPVSSPLATFLVDQYNIDPRQIQMIPNAINLDSIKPRMDRDDLREKLGYNETDIVVGFIGAMLPYHGVDFLLKAFNNAVRENNHLRLLIIGDGELMSDLEEFVIKRALSQSVQFLGRISHDLVWSHISAMDICVNPKHSWYGSPIKTFEYGSMAKAIIAPDEGNMKDVLDHLKTGYLYDGTLEGLTRAILDLSEDSELREGLGHKIQGKIKNKHTWKSNAETLINFASTLVSRL